MPLLNTAKGGFLGTVPVKAVYQGTALIAKQFTNHATNPSGRAVGAIATVRTNLVTDPAMTTSWLTGTGHMTTQTAASDSPFTGTTFRRLTADGATDGSDGFDTLGITVPVGPVAVSVWLRTSHATSWRVSAIHAAATGFTYSSQPEIVTGPAGWVRAYFTGTVATAGLLGIRVRRFTTSSASMPLGSTLDIGGALIETGLALLPYFNGSTAAGGDFTYAWTGTTNNSTSLQRAPAMVGAAQYTGANGVRWMSQDNYDGQGSYAVMQYLTGQTGLIWNLAPYVVQTGDVITFSARVKTQAGVNISCTIRTSGGGGAGGSSTPSNGSWQNVTASIAATGAGSHLGGQIIINTFVGVTLYIDQVMLVVNGSVYTGNYRDGTYAGWIWNGTPNASTSSGWA